MKQMEEDRNDVTGYLNRTLKQKVNIIQELEDKLTELSKVRKDENEEFKKKMLEWENKFKTMHEHLTSEIKLLTGKLNSMEEFRLQRDELLAKFDAQEAEIKDQQKRHKAILYEMERKVILDKERMRKDVENKLLELSTEFTKSSEIRVAAHTQRLVRENIALNNEMDRMIFTQQKLQEEHESMKKKYQEAMGQFEANANEKKRLVKTCEQQVAIIENLTSEYEKQKDLTDYLMEIKRGHEVARKMTRDNRKELCDYKEKLRALELQIEDLNEDKQKLKLEAMYDNLEFERISNIIKSVRYTVKSAIQGETVETDDPTYKESTRKNLLTDLLNILNDLDKKSSAPRRASIGNFSDSIIYDQGDLGFLRKPSVDEPESPSPPPIKIDEIEEEDENDKKQMTPPNELTVESSLTEVKSILTQSEVFSEVMSSTTLIVTESEETIVPFSSQTELYKPTYQKAKSFAEKKECEKKLLSIDLTGASLERESDDGGGTEGEKSEEGGTDQENVESQETETAVAMDKRVEEGKGK